MCIHPTLESVSQVLVINGEFIIALYYDLFQRKTLSSVKLNQMRINTLTPDLCISSFWISGEHCLSNYSTRDIALETLKRCLKISSSFFYRYHFHVYIATQENRTCKHASGQTVIASVGSPSLLSWNHFWGVKRGQAKLLAFSEYRWCGILESLQRSALWSWSD